MGFFHLFLISNAEWDSAYLEALSQRLHTLEASLAQCADRFICEPLPSAKESIAGGLANIKDKSNISVIYRLHKK